MGMMTPWKMESVGWEVAVLSWMGFHGGLVVLRQGEEGRGAVGWPWAAAQGGEASPVMAGVRVLPQLKEWLRDAHGC